jgi:HTH-type transcriptional regulator/antitoxin MqsA
MVSRRSCSACGDKKSTVRFDGGRFTVEHAGLRKTVERLSGWRCGACDEIVFDAESAERYAAAGDELVLKSRKREQQELKRIRQKLGLTQQAAAAITGGGHNAFSRYERGTAQPMPAVVNLFKLLDRRPELLREILPARRRRSSSSKLHRGTDPVKERA